LTDLTDKLIDKLTYQLSLNPNETILVGDEMYSTQFSFTNNKSLSESIRVALENKLSIFNADNCFKTLKQYYNISNNEDLLVVKTDINSNLNLNNLDNPYVSNSVLIRILNPITKKELNITLCNKFEIKTPIKNPDLLNLTFYTQMNSSGIDAFDPNDDAFTSGCFRHVDNMTGYDTTINYRRSKYFLNKSALCKGSDCTYEAIDENDYVICNCANIQSNKPIYNEFVNYFLTALGTWNFYVVNCYHLIIPVNFYLK
jgi:hypothetical protein